MRKQSLELQLMAVRYTHPGQGALRLHGQAGSGCSPVCHTISTYPPEGAWRPGSLHSAEQTDHSPPQPQPSSQQRPGRLAAATPLSKERLLLSHAHLHGKAMALNAGVSVVTAMAVHIMPTIISHNNEASW